MPRHCPALLLALLAATALRADDAPEPPKEFDPKAIDAYLAKQVAENGTSACPWRSSATGRSS